ncbi:MAG: hypothetical protein ACTH3D_09435 [Halomonas sp.]|uniref:hypothetical protein n=1 Tax=Halomonas sp. TaxID=1486246 RepID=UPI003F8E649F
MDDDALVKQALDALRALEDRLDELAPGITEEDDVYPGDGMAGLSLIYHIIRTECSLEEASRHLEEHCRELEIVQTDYRKARQEPLRLTLEEIDLAGCNHFPPPQVATNTLMYAIARVSEGRDAYLGQHGGLVRTDGREMQRQRTSRQRHHLAGQFFALRQQHPGQYPLTDEGYRLGADVLKCTENQLREAVKELGRTAPLLKAAWESGFPAPAHKKQDSKGGKF